MPKRPEETENVSAPSSGRWVWSHRSQTVDFISCSPAEEGVSRRSKPTDVQFRDLQLRAEWLAAGARTSARRGRQSTRKALSPGHLTALTSSARKRRGPGVSMDDVKQMAVGLLQENYLLPIPFSFLTVFKSKELDDILAALLLYLSCFFEHKSQENHCRALMVLNMMTGRQEAAETAKLEMAKKQLAVCYFSLFVDVVVKRRQHTAYYKRPMLSSSAEWLLDACLYSFLCYVAWVAFGRKRLRDIQEEVGRLLYSDAFNAAVRNTTDGDFTDLRGSPETGDADPEQAACDGRLTQRMSQRGPAMSSIVNQRSPLLVSLFPSPKEQSPHLFLGSRARRQSPLQAERCDTEALMEQLNQQLASVSFGIVKEISGTLKPHGEQSISRDEAGSGGNNSRDRPGVQVEGSSWSSTVRDSGQASPHTTDTESPSSAVIDVHHTPFVEICL